MTARAIEILPEGHLSAAVDTLIRLVEAAGACIVFTGTVVAVVMFVRALVHRDVAGFTRVRLTLGRFLALGLEFLLAADILSTAVAPTFEELGKLAAVAAIRTALNYFLSREIAAEQREVGEEQHS
ncbi:DUF1622 domain-containing protein [Nocardioides sp. SYSU DS0651]|uniref:DUF1622 domain-containing protein n=1 Tax=Nocardioides sp. SYSU DS0651 TaxID=3415955 RepID=UPI003F4C77D1